MGRWSAQGVRREIAGQGSHTSRGALRCSGSDVGRRGLGIEPRCACGPGPGRSRLRGLAGRSGQARPDGPATPEVNSGAILRARATDPHGSSSPERPSSGGCSNEPTQDSCPSARRPVEQIAQTPPSHGLPRSRPSAPQRFPVHRPPLPAPQVGKSMRRPPLSPFHGASSRAVRQGAARATRRAGQGLKRRVIWCREKTPTARNSARASLCTARAKRKPVELMLHWGLPAHKPLPVMLLSAGSGIVDCSVSWDDSPCKCNCNRRLIKYYRML